MPERAAAKFVDCEKYVVSARYQICSVFARPMLATVTPCAVPPATMRYAALFEMPEFVWTPPLSAEPV